MSAETGKGFFTLPGEAGFEDLTLELAERWGADVIRDSDGTALSDAITSSGFDIYSTICLVRADNEWAKAHPEKLQQNFLMSFPVVAEGRRLRIDLLAGFFREQFRINAVDDPKEWWQVFDRTAGAELAPDAWSFDPASGTAAIEGTIPYHSYTVSFLAYTIWEAISMYNHVTNQWGAREHLMPVDPIYPETRAFILDYLRAWLANHPRTRVVRFTSMFYNFAWFWGSSPDLRYVYSDWGGYDHTVSPTALRAFAKEKGYKLKAEDFVNGGRYCSSHNVPSKRYLDWIDVTSAFVASFGKECIDLVHAAGKSAYMFYDDHWIGTEPYGRRFADIGFDGLIKCVFNGFEVRLCSGARGAKTKELRLHPYLFPTGLKGEPTFKEGGDPTADCRRFWTDVRRALIRSDIDRVGLGGYLHLVGAYPDFIGYIAKLADEFRAIRAVTKSGQPVCAPFKIAVLSAWGSLRSWICCGHFNHGLELNELLESLAGLPFEVVFLSFDEVAERGIPGDVRVIVNAGRAGSAWSGGAHWEDQRIIDALTRFVGEGGGFMGVGEPSAYESPMPSAYDPRGPSALDGASAFFRLAQVMGVDREIGRTLSEDKRAFAVRDGHFILAGLGKGSDFGKDIDGIHVIAAGAEVLEAREGSPRIAVNRFGKGRSVYLSGFRYAARNTRLLQRALYWAAGAEEDPLPWTCSSIETECAYFPKSGKLIVVNNGEAAIETEVFDARGKTLRVSLEARGMRITEA